MANKTQQQHDIVISAETKQALTQLNKLAKEIKGLDDASKKASTGFMSFKGALGAIGAAVAGSQLASLAKDAIDAADAFNDMAQRTGIAATTLSQYQLAAKLSDTSVEGIGTGLKGLSKNMKAASEGSKDAAKAFAGLGVELTNQDGTLRNSEDVMLDIAARFKEMPDGAYKSALAMELFGKAGAEMIPFLNQGKDGIEKMKQEAIELGVALSENTLKNIGEFNDALDKAGLVAKNGLASSVASLLPGLTQVAEIFSYTYASIMKTSEAETELANNKDGIEWASGFISVLGLVGDMLQLVKNLIVGGLVTPLVEGFKNAGSVIARVAFALSSLASGDLKAAATAFDGFFDQIVESYKKVGKGLDAQFTEERFSDKLKKGYAKSLQVTEQGNEAIKATNEKALNEAKRIKDEEVKVIEANVEKQKAAYEKAKSAASKALSDQESVAKEFKKLREEITNPEKKGKDVTSGDLFYGANDAKLALINGKNDDAVELARTGIKQTKSAFDAGSINKYDAEFYAKQYEDIANKATDSKKAQAEAELKIEGDKFKSMTDMLKAFKDEPIKLSFDKDGIQAEADKTKQAIQASLNANPLIMPIQIAMPPGMSSAGAGVAAGVTGTSSGNPVNLNFPFGNFQASASQEQMTAMQKAIARENLKIGN